MPKARQGIYALAMTLILGCNGGDGGSSSDGDGGPSASPQVSETPRPTSPDPTPEATPTPPGSATPLPTPTPPISRGPETCEDGGELRSCEDCALALVLLERCQRNDGISRARFAIDFTPLENAPLPRIAELRVASEPGFERVRSLTSGAPLSDAGKRLATDAATGQEYFVLANGHLRLVILSDGNTNRIEGGRWIEAELSFVSAPTATIQLVKRGETFAPPEADAALFGDDWDLPLVLEAR